MKKTNVYKILMFVVAICLVFTLASCSLFGGGNNNNGNNDNGSGDGTVDGPGSTKNNLTPSKITILKDLTNYSTSQTNYKPAVTEFSSTEKKYAGKDCATQIEKLQYRINLKHQDVVDNKSTSAAVKIFAQSTPEGLMQAMANASLSFDEMDKVVAYLAGSVDADVNAILRDGGNGNWTGKLALKSGKVATWVESGSNGKDLNDGWSLFDDWELYDRLKDYADSKDTGLAKGSENKLNDIGTKEIAGDNASWQYRSILQKVYEDVGLDGAPAARVATYMLDYAISVVESSKMANGSITDAVNDKNHTAAFTQYCCKKATEEGQYFDGLGDYDVLVYLLSFYDLYKVNPFEDLTGTDGGLKSCVVLYGYYYDYNETYYFKALQDRDVYTKQLRYEKLDTFTDTEWSDYVKIQRDNYVNTYRYKASFYETFYTYHFNFQGRIENNEFLVYSIEKEKRPVSSTTYTKEMQNAIISTKGGIAGQLAMSDWTWCYGGDATAMKSYNAANTTYQEGRIQGGEKKYEGQFYYELEELKIVSYLLENMTATELSGALYYNCYAYSGSMIKTMQGYSKNIVYIQNAMEVGGKYTTIASCAEADENNYAIGKITALQAQAKNDWTTAEVTNRAKDAANQSWDAMEEEITAARNYDYMKVESTSTKKGTWETRCEYLEDRVVARTYSCCGQRISEPGTGNPKDCNHGKNSNGTAVTKEYSSSCAISKFVSLYENILYYIAGKVEISFQTPDVGYQTAISGDAVYTPGYDAEDVTDTNASVAKLVALAKNGGKSMTFVEQKAFTISAGAQFKEEVTDFDKTEKEWWTLNGVKGNATANYVYGPIRDVEETNSGNNKETYTYKYTFENWYIDKECKYEFNEEDDIDFNINVYAGYKVEKTKQ